MMKDFLGRSDVTFATVCSRYFVNNRLWFPRNSYYLVLGHVLTDLRNINKRKLLFHKIHSIYFLHVNVVFSALSNT